MHSKIFSTAKNLRYAKRKFYVFTTCQHHVLISQAINLTTAFTSVLPVFGIIYKLVLTSSGFGRAVESILSRVNV